MTNRKILVVAAHPDDEILGLGGTILKHIAAGDRVHTIILAEGLTSRAATPQNELNQLHQTAHNVAKFLGVEKLTLCKFPDNQMDSIPLLQVIKPIEQEIDDFQPDTIYTHHAADVNIDHQIAHHAVITASRPMPHQCVKNLFFFETLSSTEWQTPTSLPNGNSFFPTVYIDIEPFIEKKLQALHFYQGEMRKYPHSRSYEGIRLLAQYRGLCVGLKFAEAFILGRSIQ